jgi:Ser/Thr protein kinase RdoA (MazF antagonist)
MVKNDLLIKAAELYGFDTDSAKEAPGHDGGRNLVFMIGTDSVLRVSSLSDRNFEDYEAEIEYVHYLSEGGASVADSIPSGKGNRIEIIDGMAVTMFEAAKGDQIADHGYRYIDGVPIDEYFYLTGKVLGKMHALSKHYRPIHKRFDFFEKYNEEYFERLIPDNFFCLHIKMGRQIKDRLHNILEELRKLPQSSENYGMVHFDYSDGNYNIEYDTGKINVFDFDNCRTCWYLYDIANLWSHGLGWIAWNNDANERRAYMEKYMQTVIKGYRTECTITDEELGHLELMVNAVLMENIIDAFEVMKASGEEFVFDEEESYNVKCLVDGISWFGFYSEIFDVESPFEVEI